MSNLSVFNFHNSNVRIQLMNNEPLFCLADVTSILKVKNAHSSRFNFNLSGVHKMYTPTYNQHGAEINQELTFINEPNLYRIIFRSNKKEAVDFQNWVFDEVLPTIRKTGSYSLTINTEQKYLIRKAVNERVHRTGEKHQAIYHKFYDYFKINSYEALPASKFDDAIKWLGGAIQVEDNYDVLARQVGRLEIIYDCQQKLHQIYMNTLEDFIEKLSPSTHYNISTLFNKIHVNLGLSLNYVTTAHPTRIVTTQKQLTS